MTAFHAIRAIERVLALLRGEIFNELSEQALTECWAELREECDRRNRFLAYGDEPRETPKRHERAVAASRSYTRADRENDPILRVPLPDAFERITGQWVPRSGMVRCPLPDHEDRTPSCHVGNELWHCFGCGAGGSIYDLGAEVYGLGLRGEAFVELRRRLALDLVGREDVAA